MAHSSLKAPPYGAREPLSAWARRFTIAARTAKRWAAAGQIPGAQKVGQRWYVRRSKAADRFGARFRRQPWSISELTEWDRSIALSGMDVLECPSNPLRQSIWDSPEFLPAVLLLIQANPELNYTLGSLMKDEDRPLQIAGKIRTIFPRMKSQELLSAFTQAAFKLVPVDRDEQSDKSVLTDRKGVRKRLTVSAFAAALGVSRAAVYSAWRKKVPKRTIGEFLRHLEGIGQAPSAEHPKAPIARRLEECENS